MDADVEFEFAGRYRLAAVFRVCLAARGRKRAAKLIFPQIRCEVMRSHAG